MAWHLSECLLLQLRSAWAIAQALNRTLVLPEFWSGQDRCANPDPRNCAHCLQAANCSGCARPDAT